MSAARAPDPEAADKMAAAEEYLMRFGSHSRLPALLDHLRGARADIFWPVTLEWWSCCDATWTWRHELLRRLRRHGPGIDHLTAKDRALFEALPNRVTVFRGCARARLRGISWTTNHDVAIGFARGHRGISVQSPIVAQATVRKATIFAVMADREESEILLDPRALQHVRISDVVAELRP